MSYRICRGFGPKALDGVWAFDVGASLKTDGAGTVTYVGGFNFRNPAGTYSVDSNGVVSMIIYQTKDDNSAIQSMTIPGPLLDASTWQCTIAGVTGLGTRVQNTGALAGRWTGAVGSYSGVNMTVDSNGYAFAVSNLAGYATGSAYAFRTNKITAFFVTQLARTNRWNQVALRGVVLGGTNIVGDYELDEGGNVWYTNTVNLIRH